MNTSIQLYQELRQIVKGLYYKLKLFKLEKTKGRKLAVSVIDTITLALFKQVNQIDTKKSVYRIFKPNCSYKTLVVNMNRFSQRALAILMTALGFNRQKSHLVKYTDSTDIPVCSNRKAKNHQTMKDLASWGYTGKGPFYGLKLHLTADYDNQVLALKLTPGNTNDRSVFLKLNKDLRGVFLADAGYVSKKLASEFYQEDRRILIAKPRKNMRKIADDFLIWLSRSRMRVELNFRSLKMFYGLITSLPRSVEGYLANYIYSLLAYSVF